MSVAIALTGNACRLRRPRGGNRPSGGPFGWGPPRICSPPADVVAAGNPAGLGFEIDSGVLFVRRDSPGTFRRPDRLGVVPVALLGI